MHKSSILFRIMLVLALLFVQLGGLTHGIAHAMAEQTQDQSLPHDKHCELCAAYAQLDSPLGNFDSSFESSRSCKADYLVHYLPRLPDTLAVFAARAPPHST